MFSVDAAGRPRLSLSLLTAGGAFLFAIPIFSGSPDNPVVPEWARSQPPDYDCDSGPFLLFMGFDGAEPDIVVLIRKFHS